MASRGKYTSLSIGTKTAILEEVAKGVSRKEIADKYGLKKSTLATLVANKKKIIEAQQKEHFDQERKRLRTSAHPNVEKAVLQWIRDMRSRNLPLSGPLVCEKARVFASMLDAPDFICSDGWLSRFKRRHQLTFRTVCGERADVDPAVCERWKNDRLQDILREYHPDDIFNADETALYYKMLPDKTLAFKNDVCAGGKRSKERLTVLIAANMSGTERCRLLVLGKASKPRCFKGIKTFPVDYAANSKAWMTAELFREWIVKLDRKFASRDRRVVLIVDNCSAHVDVQGLRAVRLEFLPPNVTATMQPLDQGVIKNLKVLYRQTLLQRMIICFESGKDYHITILSAMHMLARAWELVKPETIANCFKTCGFIVPTDAVSAPDTGDDAGAAGGELSSTEDSDLLPVLGDVSFEDFVNVDDGVAICGERTDDDIVADVTGRGVDAGDESDEDTTESTPSERPSVLDVEVGLEAAELYFSHEENAECALRYIAALRSMLLDTRFKRRRQQTIREYFKQ